MLDTRQDLLDKIQALTDQFEQTVANHRAMTAVQSHHSWTSQCMAIRQKLKTLHWHISKFDRTMTLATTQQ